jgi:aldehyde dehydrogenase (NAD+)
MWGKFTNQGQTCIAPDHVYVHASVKDAFVRACRAALERAYGTEGRQQASPHLARIVNARHAQRIASLLDDARQRGARALAGGMHDVGARFVAPTLLDGVPPDAALMREEIFGPLLPLIAFDDLDRVLAEINRQPKPLALYVWSRDRAFVRKVLAQTSSGGACVNTSVVQFGHGNLPFGGVNHSGIGSAHGFHGFKAFSHERAVLHARLQTAAPFYPPYTPLKRRLIERVLRWV